MLVILAGLFVFCSMLGAVGLVSANGSLGFWGSTIAIAGVMFASLFIALYLFNAPGYKPRLPGKSLEEEISDLDLKGLILRQSFRARRAFSVAEFEDEGSTYFIELEDGRVLVLTGQYLYDFEPIEDDPEQNQPRKFPSSEFEILRHKQAGYVLDIKCQGDVLEPELVARPYSKAEFRRGVPDDGDIIVEKTYETVKQERLG